MTTSALSVADELLGFFGAGEAVRAGVGFPGVPRSGRKGKPRGYWIGYTAWVRTVLRRREAEGILPSGEAAALYRELKADIAAAEIVIQPETVDMEWIIRTREEFPRLISCYVI